MAPRRSLVVGRKKNKKKKKKKKNRIVCQISTDAIYSSWSRDENDTGKKVKLVEKHWLGVACPLAAVPKASAYT